MKSGGYNIMRDDIALLEEHEKSPPSFSVHLYPGHWTLNNGPKFLYNNQISKTILEDIRACKIPTDFIQIFDDAGVTYYKGCLIVELVDYRPPKAKDPLLENPDVQRVVLHPNGETLWADICALNAKAGSTWTDLDALELESKILMTISPPLCLDPNPQLARLVNSVLRVSTPNVPKSLKRKATAMVDLEEDETEKARRTKILQFMNPQLTSRKPNYKTLDFIEQRRAAIKQNPIPPTNHPENIPVGLQRNLMATYSNGGSAPQITPNHTSHYSQPNSTNGATIHQPNPSTVPVQQIPQHIQAVSAPAQRASPAKLQQQQSNESAPPQPSIQQSSQPTTQPVIPQLPIHQPPIQPSSQPVAAVQAPNPLVLQTAQPQPLQPQQNASFTPSLPPANFLNQPPSKRRMSGAPKPSTPAASTPSPAPQQIMGQAQRQPTPQTVVHPQSQAALPPQTQPTQPHVQIQVQVPQGQIQHQMHLSQVQAQVMQNLYQQQQAHAMALHHPMNVAPRQAQQIQQQIQSGRSTPATASNTGSSPAPNPTALARSPMPTSAAAVAISGRNTPVTSVGTPQVVPRASPMGVNQPMVQRPPTAQAQNVAQQQQHQTGNQVTQGHAQPQGQLHWHPSFQLVQPVNQHQLSIMYQTFLARHQGHPELAAQSRLYQSYLLNTNSRLIAQAQAQAQARLNQSASQQQSGPVQGQLAHVVQGQQQLGTTLVQQTYANFNQQPGYNYFQQQQQNVLAQRARYQYALQQQQQIANGQHIAVPQQPMTTTQIQGAAQNVQNLQSR